MLQLNNITKKYRKGQEEYIALNSVNLNIEKGEYVSVTGASGAGKSTLLYVAGGLIKPDSGEVLFNGKNLYRQAESGRNNYRKKHVGFMFQQFHLMPFLTVAQNIMLACYEEEHYENLDSYLSQCRLDRLSNKYPSELSVGEKQRTAFIRAIIRSPGLLLADEPTGNLDPENSEILMALIKDYNKRGGTVLLVSHDPLAAKDSFRDIKLDSGRILNS